MFKDRIDRFINLIMNENILKQKLGKIFTVIPFNRNFPYAFIEKIELGNTYCKNNNIAELDFILSCYFSATDDQSSSALTEEIHKILLATNSKFILKKVTIQHDLTAKAIVNKFYVRSVSI